MIRVLPLACFSQVLCASLTADFPISDTGLASAFFNCVKRSNKPSFCAFRASTVERRSDVEVTLDSRLKSTLRDRSVDFLSASLVRRSAMGTVELCKIADRGVFGRVLEAVINGLLACPELDLSAEEIKADC